MPALGSVRVAQDWTALKHWLHCRGHQIETDSIQQFTGGLANLNYSLFLNGSQVVLRCPPRGPLGAGANDMGREWRVLSALHRDFPLVPVPLIYCDDKTVLGVSFQIIEYRQGITIRDELPEGWHITDGRAMWHRLLDAMADLQRLDPNVVGLGSLGKPEGFNERQVRRWLRRAEDLWPDGPPTALTDLGYELEAHVPEAPATTLLHMDLKPDNVLIDPTSREFTAIIDWDMCTRGDPLIDLGILLSYWIDPSDPAPLRNLGQTPSLVPGIGTRRDLAAYYAGNTGRNLQDLPWYLAWARIRLAAIWRQLYLQWTDGRIEGAGYESFDRLAIHIAAWALDAWRAEKI